MLEVFNNFFFFVDGYDLIFVDEGSLIGALVSVFRTVTLYR